MINFPICEEHDEKLSIICLEPECQQKRYILCASCYSEEHQKHLMKSLKNFALEYKKELNRVSNSQNDIAFQERLENIQLENQNFCTKQKDVMDKLFISLKGYGLSKMDFNKEKKNLEQMENGTNREKIQTIIQELLKSVVFDQIKFQINDSDIQRINQKNLQNLQIIEKEFQIYYSLVLNQLEQIENTITLQFEQNKTPTNNIQKKDSKFNQKQIQQTEIQELNLNNVTKKQKLTPADNNQIDNSNLSISNKQLQADSDEVYIIAHNEQPRDKTTQSTEKANSQVEAQAQPPNSNTGSNQNISEVHTAQQENLNQQQKNLLSIKMIKTNEIKNTPIKGICFLDGSRICFYSDCQLYYWNFTQGYQIQKQMKFLGKITQILLKSIPSIKKQIIVSTLDGYAHIFSVEANDIQFQHKIFLHPNGINVLCLGYDDKSLLSSGEDKTMKQWFFSLQEEPQKFLITNKVNFIMATKNYVYAASQNILLIFMTSNRYLVKRETLNKQNITEILKIQNEQMVVVFQDGMVICYEFLNEKLNQLFTIQPVLPILQGIHIQNFNLLIFAQTDSKKRSELSFYIYDEKLTIYNAHVSEISNLLTISSSNFNGNNYMACGDKLGFIKIFSV